MPSTKRPSSSAGLRRYRDKRHASKTAEPFGATPKARPVQTAGCSSCNSTAHVICTSILRLEIDGVLRSWAVPKGPSADPAEKRFAALVEDHPLEYADFEGAIAPGNYGAGWVIVWDRGTWKPLNDFDEGWAKGKLLFELHGYKLRGRWTLVRLRKTEKDWLLIKERDEHARGADHAYSDESVLSGMTLADIAEPATRTKALQRTLKRLRAPDIPAGRAPPTRCSRARRTTAPKHSIARGGCSSSVRRLSPIRRQVDGWRATAVPQRSESHGRVPGHCEGGGYAAVRAAADRWRTRRERRLGSPELQRTSAASFDHQRFRGTLADPRCGEASTRRRCTRSIS